MLQNNQSYDALKLTYSLITLPVGLGLSCLFFLISRFKLGLSPKLSVLVSLIVGIGVVSLSFSIHFITALWVVRLGFERVRFYESTLVLGTGCLLAVPTAVALRYLFNHSWTISLGITGLLIGLWIVLVALLGPTSVT